MKKSKLEQTFDHYLRLLASDLPKPKQEYRFHPTRRWRFDNAWPKEKIAVEIDGGQWKRGGGRHNSDGDREKLNEAAVLGWRVLRFSGTMLRNDPVGCIKTVRRALAT